MLVDWVSGWSVRPVRVGVAWLGARENVVHTRKKKEMGLVRFPSRGANQAHLTVNCGSVLLSHDPPVAVPSAQRRLSFRVRKGAGRFPPAMSHRKKCHPPTTCGLSVYRTVIASTTPQT